MGRQARQGRQGRAAGAARPRPRHAPAQPAQARRAQARHARSRPGLAEATARAALWLTLPLAAVMVLLHLRLVLSPAQQELREGAALWTTQLLLEGRNPYALAELPAAANVYGILYHWLVLPLAWLFGNSFPVHRALSAAAIAGSAALMWRLLRGRGADPAFSAAGVVCFYAGALYFVTPLARPDAVALLASLASAAVLFRPELGTGRFLLGLGLALPTLLTKVYLFYPPLVAALWAGLYVSPRRGLLYGALALGAAALLLGAVGLALPAYVNVALIANARSARFDVGHLLGQTGDWLAYSLPLVLGLTLAPLLWLAQRRRPGRPDGFALATLVTALLFAGRLGGHPGAHMTYLFQMVTPMLIPALWPVLAARPWARAAVCLAVPVSLVLNSSWFPLSPGAFAEAERGQADIARLVEGHRDVLGGAEVAGLLARQGRPVLDSGHAEYAVNAAAPELLPWDGPPLAARALLEARWRTFTVTLHQDLAAQHYDLVLRSRRDGGIFPPAWLSGYRVTRSLDVSFPWSRQRWAVDAWEPAADPDEAP